MKVKNIVTGYKKELPVQGQTTGMRLTEVTLDAHDLAELAGQPEGVEVEWVQKMATRMLPAEFEAIRYHAEADAEAQQLTATAAAENHQAHLSAHVNALANSALLETSRKWEKVVTDLLAFGHGITQHTVDLGAEKLHVMGHEMPLTFGYDVGYQPSGTAVALIQNGTVVPYTDDNWQSEFTPPEGLDPDDIARFEDDGGHIQPEPVSGAESFDDDYSAAMKRFVGE